ncbi:MAG: hypothetical protein AAF657_15005 [Acidobacteriota bacterium]
MPLLSAGFMARQDGRIEETLQGLEGGASLDEAVSGFDAKAFGERVVEYPYLLDWLRSQPTGLELLDVGCVLNKALLDARLADRCAALWLCNPALEPLAVRALPVYYHAAPLENAFSDGKAFPLVTCLSTLEHVGYDNSHYGEAVPARFTEPSTVPFVESFQSLARLLAPGGHLLVSFPFGQREVLYHPKSGKAYSQVMDCQAVEECLPALDEAGVRARVEVFVATEAGWRRGSLEDDDVFYADGCPGAAAVAFIAGVKASQL